MDAIVVSTHHYDKRHHFYIVMYLEQQFVFDKLHHSTRP